jgi:regulator of protease activity HflC (stomatin/prohibitin superfamily)
MIFFSLLDLETMLNSTHDPIGDFVNAVSADVIRFAAESTFEGFVLRSAELNELASFKVLRERASRIGYTVDKVVFRGYKASEQLQAMHDEAIKARTKLQLEARTAEQTEQLQDMLLEKRAARAVQERAMEKASREHGLALATLEHAEQLKQAQADADARQAQAVAADAQRAAFLKELGNVGVDLTSYLVAQERSKGGSGEQVLRLEGFEAAANGGGAVLAPHLHLGGR